MIPEESEATMLQRFEIDGVTVLATSYADAMRIVKGA
jgi:uncharacterized protein YkuJ